jgi:hypothetical protein
LHDPIYPLSYFDTHHPGTKISLDILLNPDKLLNKKIEIVDNSAVPNYWINASNLLCGIPEEFSTGLLIHPSFLGKQGSLWFLNRACQNLPIFWQVIIELTFCYA